MGESIALRASDGHEFAAYRASPEGPARGAVVVVQEVFGLNHHVRSLVDGYAAAGYAAIAPALFDRAERGVELGYTKDEMMRGRDLRGKIGWDAPLLDLEAATRAVRGERAVKPAAIGFCWGGSLAWLLACRSDEISCAVGYYGGQIIQFVSEEPRVPVLLHFGERDAFIPAADVAAIRAAHPSIPVHVYAAGHGFNCTERADHDPASAALARDRTLAFLNEHASG